MKSFSIVLIDVMDERAPDELLVEISGARFTIIRHYVGWDFETAAAIIRAVDGSVDAIALSGLNQVFRAGDLEMSHPGTDKLINVAQETPVYTGTELRAFFSDWTVRKLLRQTPQALTGKNVLFQCAMTTPSFKLFTAAGCNPRCADLLTLTGVPVLLHGEESLARIMGTIKPLLRGAPANFHGPMGLGKSKLNTRLRSWIAACDVFVTFRSLIDKIGDFSILKGKTVAIDILDEPLRRKLAAAGVGRLVQLNPEVPALAPVQPASFALLMAVMDLLRGSSGESASFEEFVLRFIEDQHIEAQELRTVAPTVQRCAFVVHPLERADLFRAPRLAWLQRAPDQLLGLAESAAARVPAFKHGRITGIVSTTTGQEVICEVYALAATPREMRRMDEQVVYDRLVALAKRAKADGCCMIGLGAYTKVIGDGGLTVSRRAAIPVTNGNSYSAAATLWAAREMVEKLGSFERPRPGELLAAKAMVIGATGSIGRVSAHLLALVFKELTLVGRRVEKLLELRDELAKLAPRVTVHLRTDPNQDLHDTDLVVTATSNDSGRVLDILRVKPGAVICDCSRPLDIPPEDAALRPDVLVIESGEIDLPGDLQFSCDLGLPHPSVYACLAETVLLTMEGRPESFSVGKELSLSRVKEIYKLGLKHGARLSAIRGPLGFITEERIAECRAAARARRR
jgi:predicted amino acid dehydrogenase